MRYDVTATRLWCVAGVAAVVVAVSSVFAGDWFAAMGWAVGAAGSAGAAIQSAALARRHRGPRAYDGAGTCPIAGCPGDARYRPPEGGHRPGCPYPIPRLDPDNPAWDDDPDDGAPRDWHG